MNKIFNGDLGNTEHIKNNDLKNINEDTQQMPR